MTQRSRIQPTVVVTGISSRLGRMVARSLHGTMRVVGLDPRGARHIPSQITVHAEDLRRRGAEDVFRRQPVDAIIHLASESDFHGSAADHRRWAVLGTQRILAFAARWGVPKVVLLSTANLYGPDASNSQFLREDAPLMAGQRFPTMRDLVEVDMFAQGFFWRHPEVDTVILRPCNVVGRLRNHASLYLSMRVTPTIMGFDPMIQVMSPEDLVQALRLALKPGIRGIFNVAGPGPAPLREVIRRLGHRPLPVPEPMLRGAIGVLSGVSTQTVPSEEIDYLKFVCMVDDAEARRTLRYAPSLNLEATLMPLR
jgi:UDP-glucose 4-epimerase